MCFLPVQVSDERSLITLSHRVSATARSTIDTCRTVLIWAVSLSLGWEQFKILQVLGFVVLVYGTLCVFLPFLCVCMSKKLSLLTAHSTDSSRFRDCGVNQSAFKVVSNTMCFLESVLIIVHCKVYRCIVPLLIVHYSKF